MPYPCPGEALAVREASTLEGGHASRPWSWVAFSVPLWPLSRAWRRTTACEPGRGLSAVTPGVGRGAPEPSPGRLRVSPRLSGEPRASAGSKSRPPSGETSPVHAAPVSPSVKRAAAVPSQGRPGTWGSADTGVYSGWHSDNLGGPLQGVALPGPPGGVLPHSSPARGASEWQELKALLGRVTALLDGVSCGSAPGTCGWGVRDTAAPWWGI